MAETLENVQLKVPHWMSRQSPPVGYLAPFQDPPATLGMKYVWHMYVYGAHLKTTGWFVFLSVEFLARLAFKQPENAESIQEDIRIWFTIYICIYK